jgi:hypothetical protein
LTVNYALLSIRNSPSPSKKGKVPLHSPLRFALFHFFSFLSSLSSFQLSLWFHLLFHKCVAVNLIKKFIWPEFNKDPAFIFGDSDSDLEMLTQFNGRLQYAFIANPPSILPRFSPPLPSSPPSTYSHQNLTGIRVIIDRDQSNSTKIGDLVVVGRNEMQALNKPSILIQGRNEHTGLFLPSVTSIVLSQRIYNLANQSDEDEIVFWRAENQSNLHLDVRESSQLASSSEEATPDGLMLGNNEKHFWR